MTKTDFYTKKSFSTLQVPRLSQKGNFKPFPTKWYTLSLFQSPPWSFSTPELFFPLLPRGAYPLYRCFRRCCRFIIHKLPTLNYKRKKNKK
jgi:hypothetical protein